MTPNPPPPAPVPTQTEALLEQFRLAMYPYIDGEMFYRYFADETLTGWNEVRQEFANVQRIVASARLAAETRERDLTAEIDRVKRDKDAAKKRMWELGESCDVAVQQRDQAEAELSRLRAERTWQPIETAPEDDIAWVALPNDKVARAFYAQAKHGGWYWCDADDGTRLKPQPTHWTPYVVPSPPGASQE